MNNKVVPKVLVALSEEEVECICPVYGIKKYMQRVRAILRCGEENINDLMEGYPIKEISCTKTKSCNNSFKYE